MTSSDGPIADPVKSLTFLERFYESSLTDGKNKAENELTMEFYNSMVFYVIDHMERLPLPSPSGDTSSAKKMTKSKTTVDKKSNRVRIEFSSGNVFEGQISKNIPHGTGRLFFSDSGGVTYQGQFRDGLPDGNGEIRWSDGSWYEGELRQGLRHGRGLYVSAEDGRRWHGGWWAHGKRHGPGETACSVDGALDYAGDWSDGRPHGRGAGRWSDGTRYDGHWARGLPHGHGRIAWPDGDVYDGDWVDGHMDGTGAYEWKSNPGDCDRLVLCLCDRYSGQWSRSKKHGMGVFYSSESGMTVRGRWVHDVLDGPCEIVLSDGRRPNYSDLQFRQNVLYGTPPSNALTPKTTTYRDHRFPASTAVRARRLPASTTFQSSRLLVARPELTTSFRWPCKQQVTETRVTKNNVRGSDGHGSGLVRADVPLTAVDGAVTPDLTGHVRKISGAGRTRNNEFCGLDDPLVPVVVDLESELQAAESVLKTHASRLDGLYRAYGAFLADGPIGYRPLMTRLGLWQMIIDSGLHALVSLADFDDFLYENGDYAFGSAHDPFEPIYPWQFVHAVCELAIAVVCGNARREDCLSSVSCGRHTIASALNELITEHLNADGVIQPKSYASGGGESWMNNRKTIAKMYDVYRAMTATAADDSPSPLPTARRLIQLYGPRASRGPSRLDSVLPAVLDAVFKTRDEQIDCPEVCGPASTATVLFHCSVRSVTTLLSEACPRIADHRFGQDPPQLVDVDARLTFAEWFRFVLLCVRRCDSRRVTPSPSRYSPLSTATTN